MGNSRSQFGGKQTSINMISQVISFAVNMAISFFLTPFITENLPEGSYGFVGLSSNFISYATLITTAVNSMAGRFIAVAYYKGDKEDVVKYYSSVIVANVVLCFLLSIPALFIILFLPSIINVPANLVQDVTALFILVFSHFFIDLVGNTFSNAGYVVNRLDMVAMRKTEASVLKGILSLAVFALLIPRLWYVGLVQVCCSIYNFYRNYQIHRRLMPEIRVNVRRFEFSKIKELLASGVWNTLSSAGSVLISGLDLLIVNLSFTVTAAAIAMDLVSIAKQVPVYVQSLVVMIAGVFAPKQTKLFAENDFKGMKQTLIYSSKIVAMMTAIPVVFMLVYGERFFGLWTPAKSSELLWIIAAVAVILYPIQLVTTPFSAIISSANKVRANSLATIAFAIAGLGTTFGLLQIAPDDTAKMLIIVGTNMVFLTLHSLVFLIPYCARIIGGGAFGYYLVLLRSVLTVAISTAICYLISLVFSASGWLTLILSGGITCVVCLGLSLVTILDKQDRKAVFGVVNKFKNKIFKGKGEA